MKKVGTFFGNLIVSIVSFLVMLLMATLSFFLIVWVITTGATFAGLQPSGDFLVLSAALIVVAAIIAGGISPIAILTNITLKEDKKKVEI